jgi:hypothetical protein
LRTGGRFGDINKAGISYYNKLIDSLLLKGSASVTNEPVIILLLKKFHQKLESVFIFNILFGALVFLKLLQESNHL